MKFTDGLWLLRDGVKPAFGLSVVKEDSKEDALNLHVATRPIRHRGDTLGGKHIIIYVMSKILHCIQVPFWMSRSRHQRRVLLV